MLGTKRETQLYLLYLHPDGKQAAISQRLTDEGTYYGANIIELAAEMGLFGQLLRRIHFRQLRQLSADDKLIRAETVWYLNSAQPHKLNWQDITSFDETQQQWIKLAQIQLAQMPQSHVGWQAQALAWIDEELTAQNIQRLAPPKVLKHWQISVLWELNTTEGVFYFKAVPEFLRREIEFTPVLARKLTRAAPPVLSADASKGFLLMATAGQPATEINGAAFLQHLAHIQQQSLPLLSSLNLRNRGPDYILTWFDHLFSDECLSVGNPKGFSQQEAQQFRQLRPMLQKTVQALADGPIPLTLVHGDMHNGNIVRQGSEYTILDWSDVCLSHPFLDAKTAYLWPEEQDPPEELYEEARQAYLAAWQTYAPASQLLVLYNKAVIVAELFSALSYVDGIQSAVEDKSEWDYVHLEHLRKVITLSVDK